MKHNAWVITDATATTEALKARINRYYANADMDYGISGECLGFTTDGEALSIIGMEEGRYTIAIIGHYADYTTEQLFNIWMESYIK